MRSRLIAISVFFILFLGAQVQSFAQASASVSYTIVVSEEMVAENNRGFDPNNMETLAAFEIELSTEQAPIIRNVLYKQIDSADITTHYIDNDQYLVVLEFN